MSETSKKARGWIGAVAAIGILALVLGADDPKKTIEAGEFLASSEYLLAASRLAARSREGSRRSRPQG